MRPSKSNFVKSSISPTHFSGHCCDFCWIKHAISHKTIRQVEIMSVSIERIQDLYQTVYNYHCKAIWTTLYSICQRSEAQYKQDLVLWDCKASGKIQPAVLNSQQLASIRKLPCTTQRHSIVHFGGQSTLKTLNKQINRQAATLIFKQKHVLTKQLLFLRYAHIWSATLVRCSESAKE